MTKRVMVPVLQPVHSCVLEQDTLTFNYCLALVKLKKTSRVLEMIEKSLTGT